MATDFTHPVTKRMDLLIDTWEALCKMDGNDEIHSLCFRLGRQVLAEIAIEFSSVYGGGWKMDVTGYTLSCVFVKITHGESSCTTSIRSSDNWITNVSKFFNAARSALSFPRRGMSARASESNLSHYTNMAYSGLPEG